VQRAHFMHPSLQSIESQLGHSPLTQIAHPVLSQHKIDLWLKRDDLLHPVISGNKWRKLKYSVDHALSLGCDTLVSMGGAYSNHLHALACLGKKLGMHTIGYIRGERLQNLTPTLSDLAAWGMELRFISRADYRTLRWQGLPGKLPGQYWLPEGGAQTLALKGVMEMVDELGTGYDSVCLPCGTGATLAGVIQAVPKRVSVLGFAVFRKAEFLSDDVNRWLRRPYNNWQIVHDYSFGGFAKTGPELMAFIECFQALTAVPLEPVYTGKMLFGLFDWVAKGYFPPGQRIVAVHTGGLQGNRGYGHQRDQHTVNANDR